ncbi:hypothetical protein FACS189452_00510 [Bacteroidia bacterium]|nr:hypothetical protein FACS189452_00510 [Bacteroidia bacterium]
MNNIKHLFILSVTLLFAAQVSAQITAPAAKYRDSTHYFSLDFTKKIKQDPIFVFFAPQRGGLTATPLQGEKAVFRWEKLDTAAFPAQQYFPFFNDNIELKDSSSTADTLTYGCYRVLIDVVRVDTIARDTFVSINKLPHQDKPANTQILPPDTGYFHNIDSIAANGDTTFVCYTLQTALHRADTLRAWIIIDTFALCGISINPFASDSCGDPNIRGRFYSPDADEHCSDDPNFRYTYYNLADTVRTAQKFPYYGNYIADVKWTPSCDIHKDADGIEIENTGWDKILNTYVPKPLWNATYKLEVTNYFGNKADTTSDTLRAYATFAKMVIATGKKTGGTVEWTSLEKPKDEKYDAPLYVKVANTSVNAKAGSSIEWKFFGNNNEDSSATREPMWQPYISTQPDEEIDLFEKFNHTYSPGIYPIRMLVTNQHGCKDSVEIKIEIQEFLIEEDNFTEAFSPASSTGNNLYFKIKDVSKIHSISRFELNVMNRYGQLVFSSNDLNFQWDGKIKGTNSWAPDGVYFFTVRAEGLNGKRQLIKQKLKGNVHLFGSK